MLHIDPNDTQLAPCYFDLAATKGHQFVTNNSTLENIVFRLMFANGHERQIPLTQLSLFILDRRPWSYSMVELDEQLSTLGFHQAHRVQDPPEEDYTGYHASVTSSSYYGESSSTYPAAPTDGDIGADLH